MTALGNVRAVGRETIMVTCQWWPEDTEGNMVPGPVPCNEEAVWTSCVPFAGAKTCEAHKCRCAKPLVSTAEPVRPRTGEETMAAKDEDPLATILRDYAGLEGLGRTGRVVRELVAEVRVACAERNRLRDALARYGEHDGDCAAAVVGAPGDGRCTCGYDDAVASTAKHVRPREG